MNFLFLYPPGDWAFGEQKVPHDPFTPPLGILYLSRILEEKGHTVEIIDFCAEPLDETRLRKAILSSDAIGMSVLTFTLENAIKLSELVKEIDTDIPLVIGGPHCSLYPKQSLSALNADISVEGEGEGVILDIAEALNGEKELSEINGVCYQKGDKIKVGKSPKVIENLDSIPFPARHLVKSYKYGHILGAKFVKGNFTSMIRAGGVRINLDSAHDNL